ncbi:MAG: TolC family protein, partial [Thiohalomonadales bacterium]
MFKMKQSNLIVGVFLLGCAQVVLASTDGSQETSKAKPTASISTATAHENGFLSLQAAVDEALASNPGLAMMQARVQALAAIPSQRATLPDTRLILNAMALPVDSFDLQQEPMTQLQVGFSQMLPYPGKLALRETIAEYQRDTADWDQAEMRLTLASGVKTVWWNIYYLDRALETIERNKQLMRQLIEVAKTKYKVGKGLQQDVLLAQLELSKLEDKAIVLRGKRANQVARMNALLDRSMEEPVLITTKPAGDLVALEDEPHMRKLANEKRPFLSQKQSVIDAAQARLKLAKKDYYPDFKLGAVYGFRDGNNMDGSPRSDFLSVMFSMNLPFHTDSRQ